MRYEHSDQATRKGMDVSRAKEWQKWKDFGASVKLTGQVLKDLMQEGHKPIPTQWVDTKKSDGSYKARLVACGQLEQNKKEIRSDAPTCPMEAFNLIASFAAPICLMRISRAKMARPFLLRPPKGGLPGEGARRAAGDDPRQHRALGCSRLSSPSRERARASRGRAGPFRVLRPSRRARRP